MASPTFLRGFVSKRGCHVHTFLGTDGQVVSLVSWVFFLSVPHVSPLSLLPVSHFSKWAFLKRFSPLQILLPGKDFHHAANILAHLDIFEKIVFPLCLIQQGLMSSLSLLLVTAYLLHTLLQVTLMNFKKHKNIPSSLDFLCSYFLLLSFLFFL